MARFAGEASIISIPGKPFPQPRPQARTLHLKGCRFHATKRICDKKCPTIMYDPKTAKKWKAYAQGQMRTQYSGEPIQGPVEILLYAIWPLAKSHHRKADPPKQKWHVSPRDDYDNVAKAVGDAGNGILWKDDGQIAKASVETVLGSQFDDPRIKLVVYELVDPPNLFHACHSAGVIVQNTSGRAI